MSDSFGTIITSGFRNLNCHVMYCRPLIGLWLSGCLFLAGSPTAASAEPSQVPAVTNQLGPTLHFNYGQTQTPGDPVADFMYFVALISPEPVSLDKSPGNTQMARMGAAKRRFTEKSFLVTCDFEFVGEGYQHDRFDHARAIRRHGGQLKMGATLAQQLDAIHVEGEGNITVEVEGTLAEKIPSVTEVRFHFNSHGRASPVSIGLQDLAYADGKIQARNELVARVNTLIFRNQPGPTKMEISVASVKRKNAKDTLWQNFVGGMKGAAVNLFIKPISIEQAGHQAMLNFGRALATDSSSFTFPAAKNLVTGTVK